MKLEDLIRGIKEYKKFTTKVDVDPYLRWAGAAHLSKFMENLQRINLEDPDFAVNVASHKLSMMEKFKERLKSSSNITRDFYDTYIGIFNIGVVDGGRIIRSSQPSKGDLDWFFNDLKGRVIINLRKDEKYWDGYTEKDEEAFCSLNMGEYIHIPLEDWDDPPPTKGKIAKILAKIDYYPKPLLIHCGDGKGKTSIISAAYRISRLGWAIDKAMEEAEFYGFDASMYPNTIKVIKSFGRRG